MRFHSAVLFALSLFLYSSISLADSPSFTYVEFEYVAAGDFEVSQGGLSVDLDMDGFAVSGSAEVGLLILQASHFELESEELFNARLEDSINTLAIGLNFELPRTSLYGVIRARNDELSLRGGGFSEDVDGTSVGAEIGARVNLTDRLELNANIGKPGEDAGSSFGVGAQFFITENFGLTLKFNSLEIEEDDIEASFDTTSIGLRYSF